MKTITGLTGTVLCVLLAGCGAAEDERRDADTPFSTELRCGQLPIRVQGKGESLQLEIGGEQRQLQQAAVPRVAAICNGKDGEGVVEGGGRDRPGPGSRAVRPGWCRVAWESPLWDPPGAP